MSSTESSHKFDERLAFAQAKAKLVALVGIHETEKIVEEAMKNASHGSEVDEAAVIDAIEKAYDHKARRDSLA